MGDYNLFETACGIGPDPWFGYRALNDCSFSMFCGADNALNVGSDTTDLEIIPEVEAANRAAGYGSVADCFHPASLLEFFNDKFPDPDVLPPCFKYCPFTFRDGENDVLSDILKPDSLPQDEDDRTGREEAYQQRGTVRRREEDEQTSDDGDPPPDGGNPGSNPIGAPLGDISNGREKKLCGSPSDRPVKRRRGSLNRVVTDDAGAVEEDGKTDEQVRLNSSTDY